MSAVRPLYVHGNSAASRLMGFSRTEFREWLKPHLEAGRVKIRIRSRRAIYKVSELEAAMDTHIDPAARI